MEISYDDEYMDLDDSNQEDQTSSEELYSPWTGTEWDPEQSWDTTCNHATLTYRLPCAMKWRTGSIEPAKLEAWTEWILRCWVYSDAGKQEKLFSMWNRVVQPGVTKAQIAEVGLCFPSQYGIESEDAWGLYHLSMLGSEILIRHTPSGIPNTRFCSVTLTVVDTFYRWLLIRTLIIGGEVSMENLLRFNSLSFKTSTFSANDRRMFEEHTLPTIKEEHRYMLSKPSKVFHVPYHNAPPNLLRTCVLDPSTKTVRVPAVNMASVVHRMIQNCRVVTVNEVFVHFEDKYRRMVNANAPLVDVAVRAEVVTKNYQKKKDKEALLMNRQYEGDKDVPPPLEYYPPCYRPLVGPKRRTHLQDGERFQLACLLSNAGWRLKAYETIAHTIRKREDPNAVNSGWSASHVFQSNYTCGNCISVVKNTREGVIGPVCPYANESNPTRPCLEKFKETFPERRKAYIGKPVDWLLDW